MVGCCRVSEPNNKEVSEDSDSRLSTLAFDLKNEIFARAFSTTGFLHLLLTSKNEIFARIGFSIKDVLTVALNEDVSDIQIHVLCKCGCMIEWPWCPIDW